MDKMLCSLLRFKSRRVTRPRPSFYRCFAIRAHAGFAWRSHNYRGVFDRCAWKPISTPNRFKHARL